MLALVLCTTHCGHRLPSCDRMSAVVPLYIGEVAPQSQRGALTSLNQFAVTVAILISEV